jgi:hypothetical protein
MWDIDATREADPHRRMEPPVRAGGRPFQPDHSPYTGLLALQRLAGNRTVTALVQSRPQPNASTTTVQRCGPTTCDCDTAEREAADAPQTTGERGTEAEPPVGHAGAGHR